MTKGKKEWECLGGAIYSVLHEAALEVVILDKAASIFYVDSLGGRGGQKNAYYFTK